MFEPSVSVEAILIFVVVAVCVHYNKYGLCPAFASMVFVRLWWTHWRPVLSMGHGMSFHNTMVLLYHVRRVTLQDRGETVNPATQRGPQIPRVHQRGLLVCVFA